MYMGKERKKEKTHQVKVFTYFRSMTHLQVGIAHIKVNEPPLGENLKGKKSIDDCSSQFHRGRSITSSIVLDCSFQVGFEGSQPM